MSRINVALALAGLAVLAACAAPPSPEADAGWVSLFDGRTLDGWKASESAASFTVTDEAITCDGDRSHLFYVGPEGTDFQSFELETEVLARAGANSGIYFHTAFQEEGWPERGFEIQVNNSQVQHGDYLEMKKTYAPPRRATVRVNTSDDQEESLAKIAAAAYPF